MPENDRWDLIRRLKVKRGCVRPKQTSECKNLSLTTNVRVANVFLSSLCLKLFKNSVSKKQTVQHRTLRVATNEKTQLDTTQ